MKTVVIILALFLTGCSTPGTVSFDSATIHARPVTGGQYDINIQDYSRNTATKVTK